MAAKKIAIVVASTRPIRVGPEIAQIFHKNLSAQLKFSQPSGDASLEILDLADHPLPLYDETTMPMYVTDPDNYSQEHTKAWSRAVSSYSGFIFVTSQNNWSVPASLKNSIDYLYNEWKGKPALLVGYGGHGGDKATNHLRDICTGLGMKTLDETINLTLPKEAIGAAATQGKLWEGAEDFWKKDVEKAQNLLDKLI